MGYPPWEEASCMRRLVCLATLSFAACAAVNTDTRVEERACPSIGLLATGNSPGRPFQVIKRIESSPDALASNRHRSLVAQACREGADAVLDVKEELLPNGNG